jgi:hypothetical protein
MARHKLTPAKLAAFCAALAETGMVSRACKAVDISRVTAYKWREEHPEFAEAWDKALKIGITALEDEAHRRAFSGWEEPVFHHGHQCGSIQKYSDTLAIFLLKAHAPQKYRDNYRMELTGADGGPVRITDTERAARIAAILAAAQARKAKAEGGGESEASGGEDRAGYDGNIDDLV